MPDLVAIAFEDEATAVEAARVAQRLAGGLALRPDAIAALARDLHGTFTVTTTHLPGASGPAWGMWWCPLFEVLFFVPFGTASGAAPGTFFGRLAHGGIDKEFRDRMRDRLAPGSSALFLVVDSAATEETVAALDMFDGTVITSPLSPETEQQLAGAPTLARSR